MLKKIQKFNLWSSIDDRVLSLDEMYFKARLRTKSGKKRLFYDGWGDQSTLNFVSSVWNCSASPEDLKIKWEDERNINGNCVISSGSFLNSKFSDWLPDESKKVKLMMIRPSNGISKAGVFFAPTSREIGFGRRIQIAIKLAEIGVTTVLIDNPYMGSRKPIGQFETVIAKFSDYPLMAAACIEENRMVLNWMKNLGMTNLCATGFSQGGFTSAAAAMKLSFPIKVIAIVPPNSAEEVVVNGIPGRMCAWDALDKTCPSGKNAIEDMRNVFEWTRLDRMPVPRNGTSIHLVAAFSDKFVPSESYKLLEHHWREIGTVEWRKGGHVSTILDKKKHLNSIKELLFEA